MCSNRKLVFIETEHGKHDSVHFLVVTNDYDEPGSLYSSGVFYYSFAIHTPLDLSCLRL